MRTSQRIIYSGRVQGVGFRYTVKRIAAGFDVTGWVRNLDDGTVELLAAGESADVEAFVETIGKSSLEGYIKGARREVMNADLATDAGFEIRH